VSRFLVYRASHSAIAPLPPGSQAHRPPSLKREVWGFRLAKAEVSVKDFAKKRSEREGGLVFAATYNLYGVERGVRAANL
jgi:hypothetical protein